MKPCWKKVALFYTATFLLTHAVSIGYVASGGSWTSPGSFAVASGLMLCPAVVAIGLQRFVFREDITRSLALRLPRACWVLFGWLFPPLVMIGALVLSVLLPGARYAPDMGGLPPEMDSFKQQVAVTGVAPIVGVLLLGLALGPSLAAVGGLGEEIGWRGFLYEELSTLGFWRCSIITGCLWALWHIPLFLEGYGDRAHPWAGALGMTGFVFLLAPILHFVRSRSGSVVACGILHGTMSSTRLLSVAFVRNAGRWTHAAIPLVLLAANIALFARREAQNPARGRP